MWFYYTPSVANYIFKATSTSDPNYTSGVEFANMTYSIENLVTFLFSFTLPFWVGFLGKRNTHIVCLLIGALGLFSIQYIHSPNMLFLTMGMVGIAWASILSMPYSLLAGTLPPQKMGFYMGVFNFFIVIPEILASLFFGWILKNWLDNLSVDEITKRNLERSEIIKSYYSNLSNEEKIELGLKRSEIIRSYHSNLTDNEKQRRDEICNINLERAKIVNRALWYDPEFREKEKIRREKTFTEERREEISKRITLMHQKNNLDSEFC